MAPPSHSPAATAQVDPEGRIAFRARIGVTGHRSLEDEAAVRTGAADRLALVRSLFAPSEVTPVSFTIMTALAEGADRLVPTLAAEALTGGRVEVEAVLPLTVDDYLDDFKTEASRAEFRQMLDRATTQVHLTLGEKLSGDDRIAAYERAGHYIVDRSDIVIAVWDGADGRGRGGTAETVKYAHSHGVPVLVVPSGGENPATALPGLSVAVTSTPRYASTREAFERLDEYNQPSVASGRLGQAVVAARVRHEVPPESSIRAELEVAAEWAVPRYTRADALALHYQAIYMRLARTIHFLAAFAVAAVAAEVVFARSDPGWLGFEIAFLLLLILAVAAGRHGRVRERWIGYRSLAEAFRSAVFVTLAWRDDDDLHRANLPDSDEPWFQRAFSEAWRFRPAVVLGEDQARELKAFIVKDWIEDQIDFHRRTADRHSRRRGLYTRIVYALAGVTIVVATLHIADRPRGQAWSNVLTFIAITLPGFGAAVTGLREHGQHRLHEERSRRTASRLARLKTQLQRSPELSSVQTLVKETHRVIIEENVGWSGVIEFQDLEMVI